MNIRKISLCIIMFFTYLSGSVADIFEIENISLNEKIELHIKDIEKTIINFTYPDKKYATITLNKIDHDLKVYEKVQLHFEWKDKKRLIKSIYGSIEMNNFNDCLDKKEKILNDLYVNLSDKIKDVQDNVITLNDGGMKLNADLIMLNNENIIRIQCYDYSNDVWAQKAWSSKAYHPKFLLVLNLTTKNHLDWLNEKAYKVIEENQLSRFQIENFSINDSLLNHMSLSEINNFKKITMRNNNKHYSIQIFDNLKKYNELAITLIKGDNKFIIIGIRGAKFFGNKEKCLTEKNNLFNYLLEFLNYNADQALRLPLQKGMNSKNIEYVYSTDYFMYKNGDEINITCENKEGAFTTLFEVGAYSKEIRGIK